MSLRSFLRDLTPLPVLSVYRKCKSKFVPVRNYEYYSSLPACKYEAEIQRWFKQSYHKKLSAETVCSFNEKIQYLRCYDNTELKTICADKYLVRDYVRGKIGEQHLIRLLGVYDHFDDIDFSILPKRFVIKTNHGCGFNIVVQDKELLDIPKTKKQIEEWLDVNYAYFFLELHYRDIPRKIIIEEFMENYDGNLVDYKIYCFNGNPTYVQMISGRSTPPVHEAFLDTNWVLQPFTYTYPRYDSAPPKPRNLNKMLEIAGKLSSPFSYVRVDLYELNDGTVLFGELTFTPAGGMDHWNPPEWDNKLGALLRLPNKKTLFVS